ncbi:hypothetical protein UWK_01940 [Desulfocapsa sulfexigens DSM 10523]|uniref:Uncharacterized protein n=1 Tax=Desulfocapsa sulfexigens (strain DSM 10523 / SB164P1) TaxID=1167006 RepID=M1PFQ9_DESSD|nr:hypothetical protein [Desulfocapsa sulfexigens]AGF78490.1 hypothetical protein UWK_01940 [Desulfocapsa sulfexigens DSM 10523]
MLHTKKAKEVLRRLQEEVEILIPYAVPGEDLEVALEFLRTFKDDQFALGVIKDFYSILPEAREEALVKISVVEEKERVFLLLLSTSRHHHFYLINDEEGVFLGEWEQGILDEHVLAFFEYRNAESFREANSSVAACREYRPLERMNEEICPSCGVKAGGLHTLGCPVEVCPWCSGQLNYCNCRFEQLGVEELNDEKELMELAEKLERKGRVPYAKEQRPAFIAEPETKEVIFK